MAPITSNSGKTEQKESQIEIFMAILEKTDWLAKIETLLMKIAWRFRGVSQKGWLPSKNFCFLTIFYIEIFFIDLFLLNALN